MFAHFRRLQRNTQIVRRLKIRKCHALFVYTLSVERNKL